MTRFAKMTASTGEAKILGGLFVSRTTYYAVVPYLPLFLARGGFTTEETGRTLGGAAFFGAVLSVLVGPFSDVYGVAVLLRISLFGSAVCAIALSSFFGPLVFVFGAVGLIAFRSSLDTLIKVHLAREMSESASYEPAMKLRYFLTNVAALGGPLLYYLTRGSQVYLSMLVFVSYLAFALWLQRRGASRDICSKTLDLKSLVGAGMDVGLLACILHGACLFYVVSQMTMVLPQYFVHAKIEKADTLISLLVSWSALLIVVLHPFYHRFSNLMGRRSQLLIGGGLVCLSQGFLCFIGSGNDVMVVAASATVFTVGELFLFPLYSVVLSGLASRTTQGTYAGLGSLYLIGAVLGPIVGAWLLTVQGVFAVFVVSFMLAGASLAFSLMANSLGEARRDGFDRRLSS